MELKDLQIKEIIENCKNFLNKDFTNQKDDKNDSDEYNLWKAYSWIEYCILLVRIKKYNLLDQPSSLNYQQTSSTNKNKKIKVDDKVMLEQIRNLLLNLNYKDEEKLLESLRAIRDLLRITVRNRKKEQNKKHE